MYRSQNKYTKNTIYIYWQSDKLWLLPSCIKTHIKTLGIVITNDDEENYIKNFQLRILNLKSVLNIWRQQNLSLKGKITILNNLVLSPLIYASSIVNTPIRAAHEINSTIQSFIWDNSTSNIAQKTLLQKIEKGILKLGHCPTKFNALKIHRDRPALC